MMFLKMLASIFISLVVGIVGFTVACSLLTAEDTVLNFLGLFVLLIPVAAIAAFVYKYVKEL